MTPSERKRAQRQRDKLLGWAEVSIKVSATHVDAVRDYAASLPDPLPPTDPNQISMIEILDAVISGGDTSREPDNAQTSMF